MRHLAIPRFWRFSFFGSVGLKRWSLSRIKSLLKCSESSRFLQPPPNSDRNPSQLQLLFIYPERGRETRTGGDWSIRAHPTCATCFRAPGPVQCRPIIITLPPPVLDVLSPAVYKEVQEAEHSSVLSHVPYSLHVINMNYPIAMKTIEIIKLFFRCSNFKTMSHSSL